MLPNEIHMDNSAERWNSDAKDYQHTFKLGQNDYNKAIFDFWLQNGMLHPGDRVLDIGCGVGKYGVMFARLGCDVTLTDISPVMLAHAEENLAGCTAPWRTFICDFTAADGNEEIFRDGFNFSISTMSPAICDIATVRRMSRMTDGYCFVTRFVRWEQPSRDAIMRAVGIVPRPIMVGMREDCEAVLSSVRAVGYTPQLIITDYCWTDNRSADEQTEYMLRRYAELLPNVSHDKLKTEIEALCAPDGMFTDEVNTEVAWIYWNTKEKTI